MPCCFAIAEANGARCARVEIRAEASAGFARPIAFVGRQAGVVQGVRFNP